MPMTKDKLAHDTYNKYLEEGLKMFPPLKGYGMKLIQFAMDEPEMYRHLFLEDHSGDRDLIEQQLQRENLLSSVEKTFELNKEDARWLSKNLLFYVHGIATMFATHSGIMTKEEIMTNLGGVCRGLMMQLHAPDDERIKIIPKDSEEQLGSVEEYLKGKKNYIIGYGADKMMFQVRISAILYFEAVGENVFAYTKGNIYEMKQRLYQIEEHTAHFSFIRISKAMIVNTKKIVSMVPENGGRGRINMVNGETVIASRAYYKNLLNAIS